MFTVGEKCHIDLDIEQLCRNNRDYVKLWIDPFYRLTRRNPPMWSRIFGEDTVYNVKVGDVWLGEII